MTTDALSELIRLAPPPPRVRGNDWPQARERLGFELPESLRRLCDTYGAGWFGKALDLHTPSAVSGIRLVEDIESGNLEAIANRLGSRWTVPYDPRPVEGGLVPWSSGFPDTGIDQVCLVREGDPGSWTILVLEDAPRPRWQELSLDAPQLMLALMRGELELDFTGPIRPADDGFRPYEDEAPRRGLARRLLGG